MSITLEMLNECIEELHTQNYTPHWIILTRSEAQFVFQSRKLPRKVEELYKENEMLMFSSTGQVKPL